VPQNISHISQSHLKCVATGNLNVQSVLLFSAVTDNDMGIFKLGWTDLIFVDLAVNINVTYYSNVFLTHKLLSVMHKISAEFIFQQDKSPAHWACQTFRFLKLKTLPLFCQIYDSNSADVTIEISERSGAASLPHGSDWHW